MAGLLEDTPEARHRRKVIALTLLVITAILTVIALIWWSNLPDEDPGNPGVEDVAEEVSQAAE